jgi:hypothetical protein
MTTLKPIEKQIRQELIDFVKIGDNDNSFVRYKALADKFGILYRNIGERETLHAMLGHISEYEFQNGRPFLSVIVVTGDLTPGQGFFTMARTLGKQRPDEDNDSFHIRERQAVFDYWKTHNDLDR